MGKTTKPSNGRLALEVDLDYFVKNAVEITKWAENIDIIHVFANELFTEKVLTVNPHNCVIILNGITIYNNPHITIVDIDNLKQHEHYSRTPSQRP